MDTAVALLILMLAPATGPQPTSPLISRTLIGLLPQGDLLVLEERRDGEAILRQMSHDGARTELLERNRPPSLSDWLHARSRALGVRPLPPLLKHGDRWRVHEIDLVLVEDAALGDRRFVTLKAHRGERAIPIWRMPALSHVEVGPLYLVPNTPTLLVAYAQSDRRGFDSIDLSLVRAALLNLEALAQYRQGERARAERLLEEAVEIAPNAGDAIYNLACLHARMDQLDRAKAELQIALGIDRVRYRLLAVDDPDLDPLREDPEVRRWLGQKDVD